jgi:mRNA interferase RelE/StbE
MSYYIRYSPHAERDLKKLPKDIQIRIVTALDSLMDNPEKHLKRLADLPLFSFRVGEFRVILNIEEETSILKILKIGKRNNIYDNL